MTKTREIPVYNNAYSYVREIYRIKIKLPKFIKHDLGQEMTLSAIKILEQIVTANRAHDKSKYLENATLQIELQWVFMRLMFDLKGISPGEFKVLSEKLSDIGKQIQAWLVWNRKRQKQS